MKESRLRELITAIINEKIKDAQAINDEAAFTGYNPLEKIRGGLFHWIAVPFQGRNIFCQLRCPNATQIEQCGDISNILERKKGSPEDGKKLDYEEIIQIRNYQEALCKIVFNIPTFDAIARTVGVYDFAVSEKKKELESLEKRYNENKGGMTAAERKSLESSMDAVRFQLGFILPDDTMAFITKWAMGNDVSDIKKINRDAFLKAACLAQVHHKAPSDYINGVFTDYNKAEIDAYALSVYNDFQKDRQIEKESKHRWFLGGRKRYEGDEMLPGRDKG
jgi:hypothetical protein